MRRDLQKTRERQTTSLLLKTFMLLAMLVTGSNAWADNFIIVSPSTKIGADDGGWAGNTIPASMFANIQANDVIEISSTNTEAHIITVAAGDWGENIQLESIADWTGDTKYIRILGNTTYTNEQVVELIKTKGLVLNGTGPRNVKVRLILEGNNRIELSGSLTKTGMTNNVAQIGDPVTYTYTLDSKFADVSNVKYKWFINDGGTELPVGDGYVYGYNTGTPGTSNSFTFVPRSSTTEKQLMVCVHVSADGYKTDHNADWGKITIAPMHTPTITQDGTSVNISVNPGYWIKYSKNGGAEESVYNNTATVTGLNNGDIISATTYRTVHLTEGDRYPYSSSVQYTVQLRTNLKITYDLNGGTGTIPVDENNYTEGTVATILAPNADFTCKDGWGNDCTFGWWSTNVDGTGTRYYVKNNDHFDNTTIQVNDNVTLYALWRTYAVFQNHSTIAAVPDGDDGDTYDWNFNVRGDGVASVKLEKYNTSTSKFEEVTSTDGFYVTINNTSRLPGYGVDRAAVFHNLNLADEGAQYRLVLYHTDGAKFMWTNKVIPVKVKMPLGYNMINVKYGNETKDREYILHIPAGATGPVPVLFSLHGANNDYDDGGVANYNALANSQKFIVVYPRGDFHDIPHIGNNVRGWLSTGQYNEDVKFFEDIIDYLNIHYMIDTDRIYMTGFSNGAMMAYSTAFTSTRFAGFAAVSGYPLNQFHLQHYGTGEWQGSHPVPFMHIHGKSDTTVPYADIQPIIDNMVYRNGCSFIPSTTQIAATTGDGDLKATSAATKNVFSSTTGCPFVYYEVEGMGHAPSCFISENNETPDWDDASQTLIWNFLKDKSRPSMSDYEVRNRMEFLPNLEAAEEYHTSHGWKRDLDNNILWQYGDTPSESLDGSHHTFVYHSLQLGKGWHNIQFNSDAPEGATTDGTMWVTVSIDKLSKLGQDGCSSTVTSDAKNITTRNYELGHSAFNIWIQDEGIGEYRITFKWNNSNTSAAGISEAKGIKISGIKVLNNTDETTSNFHGEAPKSDFEGYFNYENRLIAQWNFDLSDQVRLNLPELERNLTIWSKAVNGNTILYTYNGTDLSTKYKELTYNGTTPIAIAAGLKFKADAGKIQILVTTDGADNMTKAQLVFNEGVKMEIPYVRNSYRNDKGSDRSPYRWEGDQSNPTWSDYDENVMNDFKDCLHHINRDIVYFLADKEVLGGNGCITNKCVDGTNTERALFNSGGPEEVKDRKDGSTWQKCNFTGTQGDRCIVEFSKKTTIDRIGVNRNLIYSFYTENIAATTEGQYTKPEPGLRIVGSPRGAKVADVGGTYATYENAIAMTYGGWAYNNNTYKNGANVEITDSWLDLNVYQGQHSGINGGAELEGNRDYSINYSQVNVANVPLAVDGFPVYSRETQVAYSETVNPTKTNDNQNAGKSYHDQSYGGFLLHQEDGGDYDHTYLENYNPWTLPARGAYAKFEPTLPGVLNVDILQEPNHVYYIADEFGRLVKDNVYTKVGDKYQVIDKGDSHNDNTKAGHFKVDTKSYVKYSFNVYPGKTYYLFSNTAGMGISGFYFEPYVYRTYNTKPSTPYADEDFEMARTNVAIKTAAMSSGPNFEWTDDVNNDMDYANQSAWQTKAGSAIAYDAGKNTGNATWDVGTKNTDLDINGTLTANNKAVHVTLDRAFSKNKWQTIVLPYSMNNLQLETVFGEGTKVVLMRDVQLHDATNAYNTTVYFVAHMNQDILAGYPYLIFPTKDITKVEANVYLNGDDSDISGEWTEAPTPFVISGLGQNLVTYQKDNRPEYPEFNNYGGMSQYKFKASYKDVTDAITPGSYVLSNNKLTRVLSTMNAGAFKGYIEGDGNLSAKMINATNLFTIEEGSEADVDNIEDILLQSGIIGGKTDVYSIDGQLMRQNTDNLSGLPKGIYIVNGKKYTVK